MRPAEEVKQEIAAEYESRYGAPRNELVERGRVRDFLRALDEPGEPGPGDVVPPLFLLTLGRTRRPMPGAGGSVNAGDDYEFFEPARIGDTITIERRVLGVDERQGSRGRVFLVRSEATYRNQGGRLVARARLNGLRMGL
jgi:acyl dehydratase